MPPISHLRRSVASCRYNQLISHPPPALSLMASSHFALLFCSLVLFSNPCFARVSYQLNSLFLPVTKDPSTLQYVTQIYLGTPLTPIKLTVDLGGPFLWVGCDSGRLSSSTRQIADCSIQCSTAKASGIQNNNCFSRAWTDDHRRPTCDLSTENSITQSASKGEVVEDVVAVRSKSGPNTIMEVNDFLFSCASPFLLAGLARGVQGVLGLGRTRIALPSQVSNKLGFQRKFAICLSSSNGIVTLGNAPGDSMGMEFSNSLVYTSLVTNPSGAWQGYFINLKSIEINGKKISIGDKGIKGTKISTAVPYTTMESSIYDTFIKAYAMAATFMNMTKVASVAPFGLCFGSKSKGTVGQKFPTIDLVLQSEMVKWRVGAMVEVNDEVMCLGFLDGGDMGSETSIVMGGFQLEETLLEFDLEASMLGFSTSLSTRGRSCSHFVSDEMLEESL